MDFTKDQQKKIKELINQKINNPDLELEVRLFSKNFGKNITYDIFESILNKLIFDEVNGGLELSYVMSTTLDVIQSSGNRRNNKNNKKNKERERITIYGKDSIKKYYITDDLDDSDVNYSVITKKNKETVDVNEYSIRVSLSDENKKSNQKTKVNNKQKTFRFKNRFCIKSNDGLFNFDLTSVKTADGVTFKDSQVLKQVPEYEIEIEYNGDSNDSEYILDNLVANAGLILQLYHNSDIILKKSDCDKVLLSYKKFIQSNNKNKSLKFDISNKKNKFFFIAANPVTLHIKNIVDSDKNYTILKDYAVTYKADGQRNFLYVDKTDGEIYLINNNFKIRSLGLVSKEWSGSLIEGEYLHEERLFLAYDMLFMKNEDIRKKKLKKTTGEKDNGRLDDLDMFLKELDVGRKNDDLEDEGDEGDISPVDLLTIRRKMYKFSDNKNNIFMNANALWETRNDVSYFIDGLIFVPINKSYPDHGGSWDLLFKWKPVKYNSIDFLIKIDPKVKSNIVNLDKVEQYKQVNLYVSGFREEYNSATNKWSKTCKAVDFNPDNLDEKSNAHNKTNIKLHNGKLLAIDPITQKVSEVMDDTIVEFVYTGDDVYKWTPIRVRGDKTARYKNGEYVFGNFETIANDIWESINNPVTVEIITSGNVPDSALQNSTVAEYYNTKNYNPNKRYPFQNFHNISVKKELLFEVSPAIRKESAEPEGRLLDLGSGRGGDLAKWRGAKYADVIGVELFKTGIDYAKKYYKNMPEPKPSVVYIQGDVSKPIFPDYDIGKNMTSKIQLRENIPKMYSFDVISCQFTLHYFYKNKKMFDTFLDNINNNLKPGGYFIGTCFDGERLFDAMKGKKMIQGSVDNKVIWKIKKKYKLENSYESSQENFGMKIGVYVGSIDKEHEEYLVNMKYLEKRLREMRIDKIRIEGFGSIYSRFMDKGVNKELISGMSEDEKEFSFLNNAFIFKKRKRKQKQGDTVESVNKIQKDEQQEQEELKQSGGVNGNNEKVIDLTINVNGDKNHEKKVSFDDENIKVITITKEMMKSD